MIEQFIRDIEENVYKSQLIYRSLFVTKTDKESKLLKAFLDKKDYSVVIWNKDENIDYTNIDERIVILTFDKFKQFITILQNSDEGLQVYNFIGLSYNLGDEITNDLKYFYIKLTNNNANDTIILDRDYIELKYL